LTGKYETIVPEKNGEMKLSAQRLGRKILQVIADGAGV